MCTVTYECTGIAIFLKPRLISSARNKVWENFSQQNLDLRQKDKKVKPFNRHNDMEEEGGKERMQ